MQKGNSIWLVAMVALAGILCVPAAYAQTIKGVATRIKDGDTIAVRSDAGDILDVRLAQIDTPETDHGPDRPAQPYGEQARLALTRLLKVGERVELTCNSEDARGRSVCQVLNSTGKDLSQALVEGGHAHAYRRYLIDQSLIELEGSAKQAMIGLWASGNPINPETWRRICWNPALRPENPWCEAGAQVAATSTTTPPTKAASTPLTVDTNLVKKLGEVLQSWFVQRINLILSLLATEKKT